MVFDAGRAVLHTKQYGTQCPLAWYFTFDIRVKDHQESVSVISITKPVLLSHIGKNQSDREKAATDASGSCGYF